MSHVVGERTKDEERASITRRRGAYLAATSLPMVKDIVSSKSLRLWRRSLRSGTRDGEWWAPY